MIRKSFFILSAFAIFGCTENAPSNSLQLEEEYKAYFAEQKMDYRPARGCFSDNACVISADFNADNIADFAGLYEYIGSQHRYDNHYLDLVIIYSDKDSAQPRHKIFPYIGKVDENKTAMSKLATQNPGIMKVPLGEFDLKTPGINVISAEETEAGHFPTFYWSGTEFHAVMKAL